MSSLKAPNYSPPNYAYQIFHRMYYALPAEKQKIPYAEIGKIVSRYGLNQLTSREKALTELYRNALIVAGHSEEILEIEKQIPAIMAQYEQAYKNYLNTIAEMDHHFSLLAQAGSITDAQNAIKSFCAVSELLKYNLKT